MIPSQKRRRGSSSTDKRWENVKKVYEFDEKDKSEAKRAVQMISQQAMKNALNASTRSMVFDMDLLEAHSTEQKLRSFSADVHSEYSQSSFFSHERAIFRGSNKASFEGNKHDASLSLVSGDNSDLVTTTSESRLRVFSGIRRRKTKELTVSAFVGDNLAQHGIGTQSSSDAWMCGVCAKSFGSYEDACRHEDYHVREIVVELGWTQNSLELGNNAGGIGKRSSGLQILPEKIDSSDQLQPHLQQQRRTLATNKPVTHPNSRLIASNESVSVANSGAPPVFSRPDILTMSSRNLNQPFPPSSNDQLDMKTTDDDIFGLSNEHREIASSLNQPLKHKIDDYFVLADEALTDVCCKAEKLALSQLEKEAEFELECYSKDKDYYDKLEQREIERQRDGAYSRFRTEGKNLAEKIQNKFVDAYAVMKQGKRKETMSSVDHYKRKVEKESDVHNAIDNTRQTLYVNVIVKNSIQVVSHELDRLARQRWEEHKKKEGSTDIRNEESRAQFEKFKAAAQGQLVQLAGLALASDFTPRRIAVQLSNDLYRYEYYVHSNGIHELAFMVFRMLHH